MLESHSSALDGMVLRDKRIISFRTLSSELGIPTKQAQHVILEYIDSNGDKIVPSWAVTSVFDSIKRISLVQGKRPDVDDTTVYVAVWGIRSSDPVADNSTDVECWMATDRMRELGYLKNTAVGSSELHVNSWNPIKSGTAAWNTKGASATRVEVEKQVKAEPAKPAKNGFNSDIVTKVKAEAAAKRSGRKGNGIQFQPKPSNGKKMGSKSLASRSQPKKEDVPAALVAKKSRRRIVESDDDDSDNDDFEETQREREAMESEQREKEQAEIEREASKAADKEDDVSADDVEFIGTTQRPASGQKRAFGEQFGGGSSQQKKKYRLIEVEETVMKPNGYIETVRVKKYVDDAGNDRPVGEAENTPPTGGNTIGNDDEVELVEKAESAPKKKASASAKAKKEGATNTKATNAKTNGSSKKKKSNGSIKSFFTKK